MTRVIHVAAVDLGAESGRVSLGRFNGTRLEIEVVHRFANRSVRLAGTLSWDTVRIYDEILHGLRKAGQQAGGAIASVGIDTWGCDFGLLDAQGNLLGVPVHYRDKRTDGLIDEVTTIRSRQRIFDATGIAFWPFNTLYQLRAMARARSPLLREAQTLLFTPDLLHYWLCGAKVSERSVASTSQCQAVDSDTWLTEMLEGLEIPARMLPEIVPSGTKLGAVTADVAADTGLTGMQVITPASHDTASAVAATPLSSEQAAYLSSGTWSLLGVETDDYTTSAQALDAGFTNEKGVGQTYRFLCNIMGLWLVQQSRAAWMREGQEYDYPTLATMAQDAPAFRAWVNPNDLRFYAPDNMVAEVRHACVDSGYAAPSSIPEMTRVLLESLAFTYRATIDQLEQIKGIRVPALHIIGGGSQNVVLSQWTANALGRPVITGPVEGTTMGNLLVQLQALGEVANLAEIRQVVRNSAELHTYDPQDASAWAEAYVRFQGQTRSPE